MEYYECLGTDQGYAKIILISYISNFVPFGPKRVVAFISMFHLECQYAAVNGLRINTNSRLY
jgi:hypothetical protein